MRTNYYLLPIEISATKVARIFVLCYDIIRKKLLGKTLFLTIASLLFVKYAYLQNSNDQCSGVITLTMDDSMICWTHTTDNTTTGDPTTKPACWTTSNDDGVWFNFTATATDHTVSVNDQGNSAAGTYSPMIAIYDGGVSPGTCPITSATPITGGCLNYKTSGSSQLQLTSLTIGNTYYILVDNYSTYAHSNCIGVSAPPPTTDATTACSNTTNSPVYLKTCADVGSGSLESSCGSVNYNANSTGTGPGSTSCGTYSDYGVWAKYDLSAGVSTLTFNWESQLGGSAAMGSHNIYAQVYQGTSCAALTQVHCQRVGYFSAGAFYVDNMIVNGLDPAQDVWVYMWDDSDKSFNLPYDITGSGTVPANNSCAGSSGSNTGCNLGASPDLWQGTNVAGPNNEGATCSGGTWGSNENTVWYAISTTSTTTTIDINNVICNEGESGAAQFALFTDCTCPEINNYGSQGCFLGCAVGTGVISATVSSNTTYYIAVDGFAGDICRWDFLLTNAIPLSSSDIYFSALKKGDNANLSWSSSNSADADYYEVYRISNSITDFEKIGKVSAINNVANYSFNDENIGKKESKVLYKIVQVDKNGSTTTSVIKNLIFSNKDKITVNYSTQSERLIFEFNDDVRGANYEFVVYNNLGQASTSEKLSFEPYSKTERGLNKITSGVFYVVVRDSEGTEAFTYKFIK